MTEQKLTLGFSPCPNDTFIFDALIHGRVDTEGLSFEPLLADVEELNRRAFRGELQVTKLSFGAFLHLTGSYLLLDSGAALGFGAGPLLVSKRNLNPAELNELKVAIPGKYTTANLLFSLAFPDSKQKIEYLFSDIENAVLRGEVDAGVIIHEGRFTYEEKDLVKVLDLGEYWENLTHSPIPLGGIAVRSDIPSDMAQKLDRSLRRSVEYALKNTTSLNDFIRSNAQELSDEVIWKHIRLYVNEFSVSLGKQGRQAVNTLIGIADSTGLYNIRNQNIFSQTIG
jgi:1,4-dihydroxy-6-naphthoate synthase